jgi:hypothetical protein
MSNSFAHLKQWQKILLGCVGVVAPVIVLICIWAVWISEPQLTPRLLLILLAFAAAAGGMIFLCNKTIEQAKVVGVGQLSDCESRIDTVIVGTILFVVVLSGALIEMAGLTSFSTAGFKASCIGLLASLASLVSGVLIGFLFGVPRSVAAPSVSHVETGAAAKPRAAAQPDAPAQPDTNPVASHALYKANTNLTQISDWLTKTIVGVGLVNWHQGLTWFERTGKTLVIQSDHPAGKRMRRRRGGANRLINCRRAPPAKVLAARISMSHLVPLLEFNLCCRIKQDCYSCGSRSSPSPEKIRERFSE